MFRPMRAAIAPEDLTTLHYPLCASPKLDGIRCLIIDGVAVSRNLKPIPNKFIQSKLKDIKIRLDGELILAGSKDFNEIQSAVMSEEGEPDFKYIVFDCDNPLNYYHSWQLLKNDYGKKQYTDIIPMIMVKNIEELLKYEAECLEKGFEGVMLRNPFGGGYKYGKCTIRDNIIFKLKRFLDSEATIIGFKEKLHNDNPKEKNELGYTKRSSNKENLIGTNTLGSLIVKNDKCTFQIGSGFTASQRKELWDNKDMYLNKVVTYKYQSLSKYGIPRFPIFMRFRED